MFDEKKVEMELGGRTLTLSTGKVARQAQGSGWFRHRQQG